MSLRLILMRHAKSDWTDPFEDDHDRLLNPRGRKSATALGRWMAQEQLTPDQVFCSSAVRTQETCELVARDWAVRPQVLLRDDLYLASAQKMLNVLKANGSGKVILLIAHNPGSGQMAAMLPDAAPQSGPFLQYPTGYTSVLDFGVSHWDSVDWGLGKLVTHIGPRELLAQ